MNEQDDQQVIKQETAGEDICQETAGDGLRQKTAGQENSQEADSQERCQDARGQEICRQSVGMNSTENKGKGTWKLFVGIAVGILLTLLGFFLYRGYFTVSLPQIGLVTVKLPTYGLFHKEERIDYQELDRKLEEIEYYMKNEYYYDQEKDDLIDAAVNGVYEKFTAQDGYSDYYTRKEYIEEMNGLAGSFVGIGAYVTTDEATGGVRVVRPIKDSPAMEAGLKEGDVILKADGTDLCGMELDTAISDYVKGEEGTSVHLEILRDGETFEVDVERRSVDTESVYYSVIETENGKTGYIYISTFVQSTYRAFTEAVEDLIRQDVSGLVIDLRDNLGGDMNTCLDMLDYLLPEHDGTYTADELNTLNKGRTLLLSVRSKKGVEQQYFAEDGNVVELPITVIVNNYSASASEIFAGVMQSYGYKVLGVQSFGKGIVQTVRMLYDMSGIKYTSAEYILPNGSHIHGVGVTPDIVVEPSEELVENGADPEDPDPARDNMLDAAIRNLGE